ncbi:glycosyltransferase family 2 protein [Candidatus Shapirobacteria bacterium]|nr:glycosyltransferase family 2 protein [Candidatus Shapirobacteria bacterium]
MKKQTAVVVIPTYNEADSIGKMIDHLFTKTFPAIKDWEMKLLVVDDTSPDGTYKIVQKLQPKYPNLELYLNPEKKGIGFAYVVGFRHAMKKMGADVIIEFDADFQHPPETIPVLLSEIDKGADYVLGSRKVKGGSNPQGWGFKRVFFSEVGGLVARLVLFFPFKTFFQITDPTTGLKVSRVKGFVEKMDLDNLYSKKFGYKLEFLYKMVKLGAKTKEIPLKFQVRKAGESKISGQTAKDIFRSVFLLRWNDKTTQSFLKFAVVGFTGYFINALGLEFFYRLGLPPNWAAAIGAELAIISNFTWNNLWTFSFKKISGSLSIVKKFLTFNLTSLGAVVIQFIVVGLGTNFTGDAWRQIWLVAAIGFFVLPYNWLMYNKVIWKKKKI